MDLTPLPANALAVLATALGCGLLVGLDRERRKSQGSRHAVAGLRTFALAALSGAAAMLTAQPALVALGALLLVGLTVVGYWRERSGDPGLTTEVALFLTYLVGVIAALHAALAATLAVVLAALLTERERLHHLATEWLSPAEIRDGITLLALVLLVLPHLPDRPLWGPVLNPHVIGQLLVLLLGLQSLAHLSRRLLAAQHALALSALASGFVSSSATVATMGMAVREGRGEVRPMAGAALLSCVGTLVQIPLLAAAVQVAWVPVLLLPSLAGGALALLWGLWMVRSAAPAPEGTQPLAGDGRMFSLRSAALVAAMLTGIQALVYGMGLWLGPEGLRAGTLLASLAELHSAVAAVMAATLPGDAQGAQATIALALGVHALSKCVNAGITGGWRYALALAPGLLGHTAVVMVWLGWAHLR